MLANKKISQVLKESQTTRTQTIGSLVVSPTGKVEDITEYCALGALACEANLFKSELIEQLGGNQYRIIEPRVGDILSAFEVEDSLYKQVQCNFCDVDCECCDAYCDAEHESRSFEALSDYIIHMNDDHDFSFEEIALELERIGY